MKRHAPAAVRNRDPILAVLREVLPANARVLEIASGSGEHALHFATHLPVTWQPSDADADARASVAAWRDDAKLPNLLAPIALDATSAWTFAPGSFDAIVCINMIHIAPWEACVGLFENAARVLPLNGVLFSYGPYRFAGAFTAPSNAEFDASLRARDPRWGVRDVDDIDALAASLGFTHERTVAMPANNHCLVFCRREISAKQSAV